MSPLIFISHSSQDRELATALCEALESRGLGCWIASRDIGPGENFQEAIVRAIGKVRAMVLVFTANANNSNEIKKEVALASQSRLVVIPVRLEDVLPDDAFRYELATRQWVDLFGDWEIAIGRLADQIAAVTGTEKVAAPADARAAVGHAAMPRRARVGWLAAAAILALLVAGGAAYWLQMERAAPQAVPTSAASLAPAPAARHDISGKWITGELTNPYDKNSKSTLHFDFAQSGETLVGTVTETTGLGGVPKGIQGGQVKGNDVAFYTQGLTTTGSGEQPYREQYRGTLVNDEIQFVRQNDVASGGLPEKFTAKRE